MAVQNAMNQSQRTTDRAMKNLSTGSRLADPAADVAGSAISSQMQAEIRSMQAAKMNAEQATSVVSVAEGSLSEQNNILTRLRELSVQAASDTYSTTERNLMQKEASELSLEFDRIAKITRFGSQNLLDGSVSKFDFQVGTRSGAESRISYTSDSNTTASNLDIDGFSVADKSDALDSITKVDKAMTVIAQSRAKFGATMTRLESAQNNLGTQIENLSSAKSRISDADLAKEVSDVRKGQILQQYQSSMLNEANNQGAMALKLIG
jgi:flagellin